MSHNVTRCDEGEQEVKNGEIQRDVVFERLHIRKSIKEIDFGTRKQRQMGNERQKNNDNLINIESNENKKQHKEKTENKNQRKWKRRQWKIGQQTQENCIEIKKQIFTLSSKPVYNLHFQCRIRSTFSQFNTVRLPLSAFFF